MPEWSHVENGLVRRLEEEERGRIAVPWKISPVRIPEVDHANSGGWMRWRKNAPGIAGLVRQGDALGRSEARRSGIHRVMHANDLVGR